MEYVACGKVNLSLGILGKRQDGYHDLVTVMVPVGIFDRIFISGTYHDSPSVSVFCPGLPDLPQEENLAYRAAQAAIQSAGRPLKVHIEIHKGIPPGAGMGGGSSDAACVLLAVNEFLPRDERLEFERLMQIARTLGADVPFFLGCNSREPRWSGALCTGIGDEVFPLDIPPYWLAICFLNTRVSTRWAYSAWDLEMSDLASGLSSLEKRAERAMARNETLIRAALSGSPEEVGNAIFNEFEEVVLKYFPEIRVVKDSLIRSGALGASMTGSGSAVYGICRSYEHAVEVARKVQESISYRVVNTVAVARTGVDRSGV